MKRLIPFLVLLMFLAVSVSAQLAISREPTDYYFTNSEYIYDDGNRTINGGQPTNGASIVTFGIALTANTNTGTYTNSTSGTPNTAGGKSILFAIANSANPSPSYEFFDTTGTDNASFLGAVRFKIYIPAQHTGTTANTIWGLKMLSTADAQVIRFTYWGSSQCSSQFSEVTLGCLTTTPFSAATWMNVSIEYNSTVWEIYLNEVSQGTVSSTAGFGGVDLIQHQPCPGSGANCNVIIEDFIVCNDRNNCPIETAAVDDQWDNILVVNSTAPFNYTSDTPDGELGGWNNSALEYNIITASDSTPTIHVTTTGNANCALTDARRPYSEVNSTNGANYSTTGGKEHSGTFPNALSDGTHTIYTTCQSEDGTKEMNTTLWNGYPSNVVNFTIGTTPPSFTDIIQVPSSGSDYTNSTVGIVVNVTVVDGDTVIMDFNGSNTTMSAGPLDEFTATVAGPLHAGSYTYKFFANNSFSNENQSQDFSYNIALPTGGGAAGGLISCTAYFQFNSTDSTNEYENYTVRCFNPNSTTASVLVDPDNRYSGTATIAIPGTSYAETSFFKTTARAFDEGDFFTIAGASITGNVTTTTNTIKYRTPRYNISGPLQSSCTFTVNPSCKITIDP